ncbi:MAG: hypothetical protein AABZ74_00885 [Cyanobacteriota bacterium]
MGNELGVGGYSNNYDLPNINTVVKNPPVQNQGNEDLPSIDVILQDQSSLNTATGTKGRVPSSGVSFENSEQPIQQQEETNGDLPSLDSFVVQKNEPSIQTDGNQMSDEDLPPLGQVERQEGLPEENDYKGVSSKDHSKSKILVHLESYAGQKFLTNTATRFITKATETAVEKELTSVIATVTAKKIAAKTGASVGEKITAGATEGMLKTVGTLTGKGVMPIGVREAARESGNLVRALEKSAYESSEILLKGGLKSLPKNTAQALVKTVVGAGEKAISIGMKTGTETAIKKVLTTAGEQVTTKIGSKTLQKEAAIAVEKATVEVAAKGSTKFAVKVAKAVPYISTAVSVGITAWDVKDAVEKSKDSKASTMSKVLAWSTVGLDVVSTVTTATGKGKPIGWAATILGIGTSIGSDYSR